jgi:hypothetical protein
VISAHSRSTPGWHLNYFSAVSFFYIKERRFGRFPKILLGFCFFCFKRFERKCTPFLTGPILILFVTSSAMLLLALE